MSGPLGFRYLDVRGRVIRSRSKLNRIAKLAVPPAWTDVWICPDPRGHLQATGRDARGRKQYRYHAAWRACRDGTKFDRLAAFAASLPTLRAATAAHLARPGLPREKVLAAVVQLLERSLIRVGNDEYARDNGSFGLTTLRNAHVNVRGSVVRFQFRGKSRVRHAVAVTDRRLARIVQQCRELPGQELFQYIDDRGRRRDVNSADVNAYLKEITREDFTAKDFRTWVGTVLAAVALRECGPCRSPAKGKRTVSTALEAVAGVLGNTRAVCRKSYVHPVVIDAYLDGSLERAFRSGSTRARNGDGLRADEQAVLALLTRRAPAAGRLTRAA
jgi:DNA topoisomerase-1